MSQTVKHESQAQEITFEKISARKEGAVLFAEILALPMNLIGPELVRDLVSVIRQAEAEDAIQVLVFKSSDPDYLGASRKPSFSGCL